MKELYRKMSRMPKKADAQKTGEDTQTSAACRTVRVHIEPILQYVVIMKYSFGFSFFILNLLLKNRVVSYFLSVFSHTPEDPSSTPAA